MAVVRFLGHPAPLGKALGGDVPRARRKDDRINQVYRWLVDFCPTPYPTKLRLFRGTERMGGHGYVEHGARHLTIYIDTREPMYACLDTLLHEMAHAVAWKHQSVEKYYATHSDEWGISYAKIYRAYFEGGGREESAQF